MRALPGLAQRDFFDLPDDLAKVQAVSIELQQSEH